MITINAAIFQKRNQRTIQRLLKMIGAVIIVVLTLAAVAETFAQTRNLPDRALCVNALNPDRSAWARNPDYSDDIAEAKRRGLTVDACRKLIAQPNNPSVGSSAPAQPADPLMANLDDQAVCRNALIPGQSAWDNDPRFLKDVTEATRRGYTADTCRQLLAQPYAPKSNPAASSDSGTSSPPASTDSGSGLTIIFLIAIVIYFLPAIIASSRHHRNQNAIFVLNLFLGWTLVGWVIALVWSNTADTEEKPVVGRIERLRKIGRTMSFGLMEWLGIRRIVCCRTAK